MAQVFILFTLYAMLVVGETGVMLVWVVRNLPTGGLSLMSWSEPWLSGPGGPWLTW